MATGIAVTNNMTYSNDGGIMGSGGYNQLSLCSNPTVTGNYFMQGYSWGMAFKFDSTCTNVLNVQGNAFWGSVVTSTGSNFETQYPANTFYGPVNGSSGYGRPVTNRVACKQNQYETNLMFCTVYNWTNSPTVDIDVLNFLPSGSSYRVWDAQNILGAPLASGVASGSYLRVTVPTAASPVSAMVAAPAGTVKHTNPEFNVFVVQRVSSALSISSVQTSNITSSTATVTWDTTAPATSQVQYSSATSGLLTRADSSMVTTHSVSLTNLTPATTHRFNTASSDAYGNSATAGSFTFTTTGSSALAISAVSATNVTSTTAVIKWVTNASATGSVKYGTTTVYDHLTPVVATLSTSHSIAISDLTPGTRYNFVVVSTTGSGSATSANHALTTGTSTTGVTVAQIAADPSTPVDTLAFKTTPRAGAMAIVVCLSDLGNVTGVSDNQGNTYSKAVMSNRSATGSTVGIFYGVARSAAGTFTVSCDGMTASWSSVAAYEVHGLADNRLDQVSQGAGASTTPGTGTMPVTTVADEIQIAGVINAGTAVDYPAAGWTRTPAGDGNAVDAASTAHRIVSATGAYSCAFTQASPDAWAAVIATFK